MVTATIRISAFKGHAHFLPSQIMESWIIEVLHVLCYFIFTLDPPTHTQLSQGASELTKHTLYIKR